MKLGKDKTLELKHTIKIIFLKSLYNTNDEKEL